MKKCFLLAVLILSFSFTSCLSTKVNIKFDTDLTGLSIQTSKSQKYKIEIYGELKNNKVEVMNIYWFDNWGNGWTEARFAATGVLSLVSADTKTSKYAVEVPLKLEYLEEAKIRFKDTYLSGEEAVRALNNRIERIESLNEILMLSEKVCTYDYFNTTYGELLFPEKYKKSDTFAQLNKESETVFADGTKWNVEYTKSVFPEYMWEARNTGTLYRDWEESLDLIYILNRWNNLFGENKTVIVTNIKTKKQK